MIFTGHRLKMIRFGSHSAVHRGENTEGASPRFPEPDSLFRVTPVPICSACGIHHEMYDVFLDVGAHHLQELLTSSFPRGIQAWPHQT